MSTVPTQIFEPKKLKHLIDKFEVYQIHGPCIEPFRVLPLGVVQIFFQLKNSVYHNTSFTGGWEERPTAFVAGPYNRGYTMYAEPGVELFSLKLVPGEYQHFFSCPIDELKNKLVPVEEIWDKPGKYLIEQVFNASGHRDRCQIVEEFLIDKYQDHKSSPIALAAQCLESGAGNLRINRLAEYCNLSQAQFRKRFVTEIGLSPKEYQRVRRVSALHDDYLKNPTTTLTQLAYRYHYHDQSHFIHDFSSITGLAPREYFN